MAANQIPIGSFFSIEASQLQTIDRHAARTGLSNGWPTVADGSIIYADLASVDQLPLGYIDRQDGGSYRLEKLDGAGYFDHVVGPYSLKNFLFPPRETLLESIRKNGTWQMTPPEIDPTLAGRHGRAVLRSCTPWRFKTKYFWAAPTSIQATKRGGNGCFSWR